MNIILLTSQRGKIFGLNLTKPLQLFLLAGMVGAVIAGSGYVGYALSPNQDNQALINEWKVDVIRKQAQLQHIRTESSASIDALSSRIGLLQAHVCLLYTSDAADD